MPEHMAGRPSSSGSLLHEIVSANRRIGVVLGLGAFALIMAYQLFVMPQTYEATVSLSIQQNGPAPSALAMLAGQSTAKKYIGILRSRRSAERVDAEVGLQRLYGLQSRDDVLERMAQWLKVRDDATDGLLYATVALPGPSRFSFGGLSRGKVAGAAAQSANAYAHALQDYYADSDNERDAVLLREANRELAAARKRFAQATANLTTYVRRSGDAVTPSPTLGPTGAGLGAGAAQAPSASGLPTLLTALAEADAALQAAEAGESALSRMTAAQLRNLSSLPAEDPTLLTAREEVTRAQSRLATLRIQYGEENPQVVAAREVLRLATRRLARETRGIARAQTTPQISAVADISSLRAKRDALRERVSAAEAQWRRQVYQSADYDRLKNELALRLEALKTTETEAAKLRLGTASAQSRVAVIDPAVPPRRPRPGIASMALLAFFVTATGLAALVALEYNRQARMLARIRESDRVAVRVD